MRKKPTLALRDDDLDLNPLIDVITILLVFFIIGGRINDSIVCEQITLPPTLTGAPRTYGEEAVLVLNLYGDGQRCDLRIGTKAFIGGSLEREPWVALRELLDRAYDHAPKRHQDGVAVACVTLEVRADADTPYRMIQDVMAIAADTIDPLSAQPRPSGSVRRPFTDLRFDTRDAGG
ncbi:MAG TPA: biopolymer transporter ExbD [Planctomycetota bacterium]|nr:biopolymer transporter ExbD [Planctomycetota bacterium]